MTFNAPQTSSALFSKEGVEWDHSTDQTPVSKLVIGTAPTQGKRAQPVAAQGRVLEDLKNHWATITHLHLWGVENLAEILASQDLPPALVCLDLRGCTALESLPTLPKTLQELDLGGCKSIALPKNGVKGLQRLFLDDCHAIKASHLDGFLEDCPDLVELNAQDCPAVKSLEALCCTNLKKLVLFGCKNLGNVGKLAELPALRHLDLGDCLGLTELPDIPNSLQYLRLAGSHNLRRFHGQDIGIFDRGTDRTNVAGRLRSRKKFGAKLSIAAHAKLLLLGDGRVGKTTLAKRLQWETLCEPQRAKRKEELEPKDKENPTHKMRVWSWTAPLVLPEGRAKALAAEAEQRKLAWPESAWGGELDGQVGIWDFGGQEIYHNTHRVFARQGSVFVIVWNACEVDQASIDADKPAGALLEEWREVNTRRPLEYWLDYVYSMRPDAQVALVCTCCDGTQQPSWEHQAPGHKARELPCYYIDSLDKDCAQNAQYGKLTAWLMGALGREADERIGIVQPAFYSGTAAYLGAMLETNSRQTNLGNKPEHLLEAWDRWCEMLKEFHRDQDIGAALDDADIEAITGYLHDAGHLMLLEQGQEKGVMIDQSWGTGLIYGILRLGGDIHQTIIRNGGWFPQAELEEEAKWKQLDNDLQRTQLLRFMEDSGVLVPYLKKSVGQTIYVANEKWLLPKMRNLDDKLKQQLNLVKELPHADCFEEFSFEQVQVSEFEFRRLMAYFGGILGRYATWFQEGLQAMPDSQEPDWCLRLRWQENSEASFLGGVDASLHARREHIRDLVRQVEELFADPACPLARHGQPTRRSSGELDLTEHYFTPLKPGDEVVGVSSSGADKQEAQELVRVLKEAGIATRFYLLPECRCDESEGVKPFMDLLGQSPVIILYLSDAYLKDDPESNWYCLWELADAVNKLAEGLRSPAKTLVIYKPGEELTSKNLDDKVAPLFGHLAEYFEQAYTSKPRAEKRNFAYYNDFFEHFQDALEGGRVGEFFGKRGTLGTYDRIPVDKDGNKDYSTILESVRKAIQ